MPPKAAGNQKLAAKKPPPLKMSVVPSAASASSIETARDDAESPSSPNETIEEACVAIGELPSWKTYDGEPHIGFLKSSSGGSYVAYSGKQDRGLDNDIDGIMEKFKLPYKAIGKLAVNSSTLQEFIDITNHVRTERGQTESDKKHKGAEYGCPEKKLYSFLTRASFEYQTGSLRVYYVQGGEVIPDPPCESCVRCMARFDELANERQALAAQRKADEIEQARVLADLEADGFTVVKSKKRR